MSKNLKILPLLILSIAIIGCHHTASENNKTHEPVKMKAEPLQQKPETEKPIHWPSFEKSPQTKICQKRHCVFPEEPIPTLTLNGVFQYRGQKIAFIQDTAQITQMIKIGDVLGDEHWIVQNITLSSIALEKKGGDISYRLKI